MGSTSCFLIIHQMARSIDTLLINKRGECITKNRQPLEMLQGDDMRIEYDALEVIYAIRLSIHQALNQASLHPKKVKGIGVVTQPNIMLSWDKYTGQPTGPAISYLKKKLTMDNAFQKSLTDEITQKTGLPNRGFYAWRVLRDFSETYKKPGITHLMVGTLDTWIIYHLTGKKVYKTDLTNAYQTQLLNVNSKKWDPFIVAETGFKLSQFPEICSSGSFFGETKGFVPCMDGTPILGVCTATANRFLSPSDHRIGSGVLHFDNEVHMMIHTGDRFISSKSFFRPVFLSKRTPQLYAIETVSLGLDSFKTIDLLMGFDLNTQIELGPLRESKGCFFIPRYEVGFMSDESEFLDYSVMGINSKVSLASLHKSAVVSLCHHIRHRLLAMEKTSKIRLKELVVLGDECIPIGSEQLLADLLQISITKKNTDVAIGLGMSKLMDMKGLFLNKRRCLSQSNLIQNTYVPELDPLSSYALHQPWKSAYDVLNST